MKLLIVCLFILQLARCETFQEFKIEMQAKVKGLAQEMESIFARRCETQIATCQTKSYNQCEGTSEKKCFDNFPKPEECLDGGAYLSTVSAVRFPNNVNVNSLTTEEKQFVCTSAMMETKFNQLDDGREKRYGIAYIGTSLGSFRAYPTFRQIDSQTGECNDYDPRFRPWYVIATSGAKNVLLMIDTSGSMTGDRMTLAIDAAKAVVNTLSNNDFVGVIQFASSASTVGKNKITRATTSVKETIISAIDGLSAVGSTNYQSAFRKAFSMLNAAENDEYGAPCNDGQNVFLFLTDGEPTMGETTSSGLITIIDSFSTDITLFTYALGSGADTTILNELACEYSGIMFQIQDSASDSALATTMRNYYSYISEGVEITQAVWTEPYDDAFGFGRMVTVSMPIYYEEGSIRTILGVAGIDIIWEQISFGMSEEDVIKKLISNMPCQKSNLTECQIEELRETMCGVSGCTSSGSIVTCSDSPGEVFLTANDSGSYVCCGLTIGGLIGIIVAVVVVIGIIIGVVCYKMKKAQREREARVEIEQVSKPANPSQNRMINQQRGGQNPYGNPYQNNPPPAYFNQPNYPQY